VHFVQRIVRGGYSRKTTPQLEEFSLWYYERCYGWQRNKETVALVEQNGLQCQVIISDKKYDHGSRSRLFTNHRVSYITLVLGNLKQMDTNCKVNNIYGTVFFLRTPILPGASYENPCRIHSDAT
jgi:hypothetical protein